MPDSGSPIDTCLNNNLIQDCKPDSQSIKDKLNNSKGSEFYSIDFNLGNLYAQQNLMPKKCREDTNFFFVSYSCEQSV